MKIVLGPFKGELPSISDKMLPEEFAASCINADLSGQSLRPSKPPLLKETLTRSPKSIYRNNEGKWLSWTSEGVSVCPSPLNDDVWKRIYWSGDGPPKMAPYEQAFAGSFPGSSYRLGIPAPESAPTPPPYGMGSEVPEDAYEINTAYIMTFVSAYGEEGAPSPASSVVTRWDNATLELTNIPLPPSGPHNIESKRIYRSETSGEFLLVAEIPAAQIAYSDNVNTEELGLPLSSLEWDMPSAGLKGLQHIGNGILAGWYDNTLCFSEAYRPHAWPAGYQMGFDADIVGIASLQGGLVVATKTAPWLVSGTSPASMVQTKIDYRQGAVSRYSVVDMGDYAIYASDLGLVAVAGSTPQLITKQVFNKDQWQQINPKSIKAFRWREQYLAFYKDNQGQQGAFLFDPDHGIQKFDATANAAFQDPATGSIFIANGKNILEWEAGDSSDNSFVWQSKIFTLPRPLTLSAGRVDAETYPINIEVTADGEEVITLDLLSDRMFRLPPGMRRAWQIKVTGKHEVYGVQLADLPSSLF